MSITAARRAAYSPDLSNFSAQLAAYEQSEYQWERYAAAEERRYLELRADVEAWTTAQWTEELGRPCNEWFDQVGYTDCPADWERFKDSTAAAILEAERVAVAN